MAEKQINIRINTIETKLNQSLKKIEKLEKTIDKLNKKKVRLNTSAAEQAAKRLRKEIEKGNKIVDKLFDSSRSTGFGNSIGRVRDELGLVRKAFDAANSAASRQEKATALIAGNFKKIRMEAVAFAQASGNKEAMQGAMGGSVQTRLKEIKGFPKTILAGREAMGLLNRMLEMAEVNSKDFLDINKAIGKQLKINADMQKAANDASGRGKKKSGNAASNEKLEAEKKATRELEKQKKLEQKRFDNAIKNIRRRKNDREKDRKMQRQGRLLGAGFPLLFGGGIGSVAGSLAGSFSAKPGEEFGAQIFGSAIGAQLETLVRRANALGEATREISFEKLEEQSIIVSGELKAQVELLKELGQKDQARNIIAQQVFKRTGATADVTRDINRSVEVLNAGFSELANTAGVTLGIIGAPLLQAVGAVAGAVSLFFRGFNTLASGIRSLLNDLPVVDKFFERFDKFLSNAAANSAKISKEFNRIADSTFTKFTIEQQRVTGAAARTFDAQRANLGVDKNLNLQTLRKERDQALKNLTAGSPESLAAIDAFAEKENLLLFKFKRQIADINEQEELRNQKLERQTNLITQQTAIRSKIVAAELIGDEQTARRLQFELEKVNIQNKLGEDLRNAKSVEEEILLVKKAIAQTDAVRLRINSQLTQQETKLKSLYESIGQSIENGLVSAIQGAIDGTRTLGDVARSVFSEISSSLIRFGVNSLLGSIFPGSRFFRANGGTVSKGKSYMVGERGAEMFVPNAGGRIVPNEDLTGGSTNIVVNVDASGSNVEGNEREGQALGLALSAAIESELIKQKRPGGLLA
jgi:hypothetical protein